MPKTIQIKCKGSGTAAIDSLKVIQGELKSLSEENKAKLRTRIETLGFDAPIFVWRGHVLDGTQRLRVLEEMVADGWVLPKGHVPVCEIAAKNLTEAKERLLGYVSQYGKIDQEGFVAFTEGLDLDFGTLDLPDFDLDGLMASMEPEPERGCGEDEIPEPPKNVVTKPGDLWILGEHRLLCGDATKAEDVERVLSGNTIDMVLADPPYGIGKDIENDNLKGEKWLEFYSAFTNNILAHTKENGYVFVWGYFDTLSDYWQLVVKARGDCNYRNFIVWKKTFVQGINSEEFRQFPEHYEACLLYIFGQPFQNGPWSTSPNAEHYWDGFEPIRAYLDGERQKMGWDIPSAKKLVGHSDLRRDHWFSKSQWSFPTRIVYEKFQEAAKGKAFKKDYDELRAEYDELRGYFDNSHGFTDVWEVGQPETFDCDHPTKKPVQVCERGILTASREGEIVADPFLGSGTTLIAAEKLGRRCYGTEIEPKYCDVIVERWQQFTGQKAKRQKGPK